MKLSEYFICIHRILNRTICKVTGVDVPQRGAENGNCLVSISDQVAFGLDKTFEGSILATIWKLGKQAAQLIGLSAGEYRRTLSPAHPALHNTWQYLVANLPPKLWRTPAHKHWACCSWKQHT